MSMRAMRGSDAGLVRMGSQGGKPILVTSIASADSGATCQEAKYFTRWRFQLAGTFTGYSVQLYGTLDANTAKGLAANWFPLDSPAVQSGTGNVANPLTNTTQSMQYDGPLQAARAVATGTAQTGTVTVLAEAIP